MIEKLAEKYKYENGVFYEKGKRGPKVALNSNDMIKILLDFYKFDEVEGKLNELARICAQNAPAQNAPDVAEMVKEILLSHDFLKDFRFFEINDGKFLYLFKGNRAHLLQVGFPASKDWVNILLQHKNEELVELQEQLAPLLYPKAPYYLGLEEVAGLVTNTLRFSKRDDLKETLPGEMRPVSLSISPEASLYKVPYEQNDSPVLSPLMAEFLSRVSDADYLCAIIWITFNGIKSPYVVYLYGTGGEGKSSFLNIMSKHIGSSAAFQKHNQFSNFGMYGKAMVVLCENTDCFLLQDHAVKQLTGTSMVSCEPKGKNSFNATLQGTLFADANKMLKLKGEDAEFRRLRLFKIKKPVYKEQLDMDTYTACLGLNFNDFLNHCRICFEKVGSKTSWLVPPSPTQEADFLTYTDKALIHNSEAVLSKIFRDLNLEYFEKAEFSAKIFWDSFFKLPESKEKFLMDNLKDYLFLHKNVSEAGNTMYGVRQKASEHTNFVLPSPANVQ